MVVLPFSSEPEQLSKKEVAFYFQWFLGVMPERIEMLRQTLALNDGGHVALDYTLGSLRQLGAWFGPNIGIRFPSEEEIEEDRQQLPEWLRSAAEEPDLSYVTYSLCYDTGIYFGETMRRRYPFLRWEIVMRPKSDVDLHKPVLDREEKDCRLNPMQIMTVVARKGAFDRLDVAEELARVAEVWDEIFRQVARGGDLG